MVLLEYILILGLIFISAGAVRELVNTNWAWCPTYYGILLIAIAFILLRLALYHYNNILIGENKQMIYDIIKEIEKRGYCAQEQIVEKNGVSKIGISVAKNIEDPIRAVYYLNELPKCDTPEMYAELILQIVQHTQIPVENFNINLKDDLDNIYIGVQSNAISNSNNLVLKPSGYDGIDMYLYYFMQDNYAVKITSDLLEYNNIKAETLFDIALANTCDKATIKSMSEILFGVSLEDNEIMYIMSNERECRGAASMLDRNKIIRFGLSKGWKAVAILPSSIHEVILVPYNEKIDNLDAYKTMVTQINNTEVAPEEKLTDDVYIIEF